MTVQNQKEKLLRIVLTALAADSRGGTLIEEMEIADAVALYAPLAAPGLDEGAISEVVDEIARRLSVWSGAAATLRGDDPNHLEWLAARKDRIHWRFWERYRAHLETRLPPLVVNEQDESTDLVLSLLEDPTRPGAWRRQGMVVGHVQAGKTGNYIGLIAKAADAGYKVVVVLSGIHNSLRVQTQIRLEEGFLGYTREDGNGNRDPIPVGVGLIDRTVIADSVTTRHERGDFNRRIAQGFQIHAGGKVLLFVVKKNVSVLQHLVEWSRLSALKPLSDGRTVVADAPLLVIDDEADQASIDIKFQPVDEATGLPDPEHEPARINGLIRQLLETFEQRAYVGYTATPFANVFVHPDAGTAEHGPDLFPKHFITNLSAPTDYFGPAKVFGAEGHLPIQGDVPSRVRFVRDSEDWIAPAHRSSAVPRYRGQDRVPPSLELAVRSFILACAARRRRGQGTAHKTMLVHVSRFTAVQELVFEQVRQLIADLKARWRARETTASDPLRGELRELWEQDFNLTSDRHFTDAMAWEDVETEIWPVFELLKVSLINGKAADVLSYETHKASGLHVIAIGGDKLSRGLTLEGLTVSYFLRSSRMYDTLMQMGRWFGYRPAYEDLCRLYLTEELAEWYGHITYASEELRQEFDRMVLVGGTPDDYGLRIRSHPVLSITGRLRPGTPELLTSLSATPFEPTVLLCGTDAVRRNWLLTDSFVRELGKPDSSPVKPDDNPLVKNSRGSWPGAVLWRSVAGSSVLDFLSRFAFAEEHLVRTPPSAVRAYVSDRLSVGELMDWTVVVLGKDYPGDNSDGPEDIPVAVAGQSLWSLYRQRQNPASSSLYVTKRLGSPKDESIDLTSAEWLEVDSLLNRIDPDPQRPERLGRGRLVREQRPATRGLLILYLLTPDSNGDKAVSSMPLVAPYISFPYSKTARAVSYRVNQRYWQDELRGVE